MLTSRRHRKGGGVGGQVGRATSGSVEFMVTSRVGGGAHDKELSLNVVSFFFHRRSV